MEQLNNEDLELSASKQRNESCLSSKTERLKPPHSYIALIATAILNSPGKKLTLTEINEYLVQHYAFFRGPYQGWKNSVRHNLSFNKCFVKILRDPARPWGKDNYWTVSSLHDYLLADGTFRRRRRRKPKRKDEREELSHSIITEQILPNNAVREFGVPDTARRSILMLPSYESVRGDRALSSSVHNTNKPVTPKQFRGSFSIESILSEGKTRTKTTAIGARRRSEMAFPVRSVLKPNLGRTMINDHEEVFGDDKQRAGLASFKAASLSPLEAKNIISCLRFFARAKKYCSLLPSYSRTPASLPETGTLVRTNESQRRLLERL